MGFLESNLGPLKSLKVRAQFFSAEHMQRKAEK